MAKSKTQFVCQHCGATYGKWTGKCENCGEWNSLVEQTLDTGKSVVARARTSGKVLEAQTLRSMSAEDSIVRLSTGIADLDTVLGGGILPGGVILLAASLKGIPVFEYTPMQVKLAVAGYGGAKKPQIQQMVKVLLNLDSIPKPDDAADALAVAICQSHTGMLRARG